MKKFKSNNNKNIFFLSLLIIFIEFCLYSYSYQLSHSPQGGLLVVFWVYFSYQVYKEDNLRAIGLLKFAIGYSILSILIVIYFLLTDPRPSIYGFNDFSLIQLILRLLFCYFLLQNINKSKPAKQKKLSKPIKVKSNFFNIQRIDAEKFLGLFLIGAFIFGLFSLSNFNKKKVTYPKATASLANLYNLNNAHLKCITEKDGNAFNFNILGNIIKTENNDLKINTRTRETIISDNTEFIQEGENHKMRSIITINTILGSGTLFLPEVNDTFNFNCIEN
jgi:hypothetical protein